MFRVWWFVRSPLQCDECHKDFLCFDLTSCLLGAIVIDVRLYQPKDRGSNGKNHRQGIRTTGKDD
jgi:hypothetical protein